MVEEGESRTRQAASEVRVLRSNTGLAEARVGQLRVLVDEHRELLRYVLLLDRRVQYSGIRCQ
jgi:hypothetical protein